MNSVYVLSAKAVCCCIVRPDCRQHEVETKNAHEPFTHLNKDVNKKVGRDSESEPPE